MAETVAEILEAYRSGAARPEDIVARSYARIRAHDDPAIFISLRDEAELLAEARALQQAGYGGYVGVEYVWIDWEHCNEVDNLSETILMRDHLRRHRARERD